MREVVLVIAIAGCGRLGFGHSPIDDASASDSADAPLDPIDAPAGSVVVTFGETPASTVHDVTFDTYIDGEAPNGANNFGAGPVFTIEGAQKRALLRFDVTAVPPGKVVVAARYHFSVTAEIGGVTVGIAPILEDWTEGTASGTAGVANFTQRTITQAWTTPGAGSPGSTGAQIASFQVPSSGTIGVDLPASTVQGWVDTPSTNFGVALASASDSEVRIVSSEASTLTTRPELVVTYFP